MSTLTYTRFELLRTLRNRQTFIFTVAFPVVMYFLLASPNKNNHNFGGDANTHTGLFAPQYYMVGLLAFGAVDLFLHSAIGVVFIACATSRPRACLS